LGFKPLKERPRPYVRENIYFSVQYERVAVEQRHHVGVDHIMFATDFRISRTSGRTRARSSTTSTPTSHRRARQDLAGNAVKFFKLDL